MSTITISRNLETAYKKPMEDSKELYTKWTDTTNQEELIESIWTSMGRHL